MGATLSGGGGGGGGGLSGGGSLPSVNGFRLTLASGNPYYNPQSITPSSTDTVGDTVTLAAGHGLVTGTIVTPSATGGNLTAGTRYFINVSTNTVSFHLTVAAAEAGTSKVDLTASITAEIQPAGISRTTIVWTPHIHKHVSLYSGTAWGDYTTAEISLALGTLSANSQYSVFVYASGSTPTLELGSAWASDSPGGIIPPDCTTQDGVVVKSGATTRRLVGVIRMNSTTTTIVDLGLTNSCDAQLFVWNQDNRLPIAARTTDGTSHSYTTATWREWNAGSPSIRVKFVCGGAQMAQIGLAGYVKAAYYGIGLDSTTVLSRWTAMGFGNEATSKILAGNLLPIPFVPLGYHQIVPLENGTASATEDREEMYFYMDM